MFWNFLVLVFSDYDGKEYTIKHNKLMNPPEQDNQTLWLLILFE